jgi:hypothetical protein
MTYLDLKRKTRDTYISQVKYMISKGQKPYAPVNIWCEFCMLGKKRWEIRLVDSECIAKLEDEWVREALEKASAEFVMCCEDCLKKHNMTPMKNEMTARYDGESEAMRELFRD